MEPISFGILAVIIALLSNFVFVFLISLVFAHYLKKNGVFRSREDKILGGVCGGLAKKWKIDSIWLRLAFIVLIFGMGASLFCYIFLWIFMKKESKEEN